MKGKDTMIRIIRAAGYAALAVAAAYVYACRSSRSMADHYATVLYPMISCVLSGFSSLFPFSLEELTVLALVIAIVTILVQGIRKHRRWYGVLFSEAVLLLGIAVWFYLGWGLNYSRSSLPERLGTPLASFDESTFKSFLSDYAEDLNNAYIEDCHVPESLEDEVKAFYRGRRSECGLSIPRDWMHPKRALASGLFSKVGVTGSMGPFFSESLLNGDMPDNEWAFTYAHEFAHLMGVSSEAEANFWAYRFCVSSPSPEIRYSGLFTIMGNILSNARTALSKEEYADFISSIRPEVREAFNSRRGYWDSKYSHLLGSVQEAMYNAYLKGNFISSGTQSYNEVMALLMTELDI